MSKTQKEASVTETPKISGIVSVDSVKLAPRSVNRSSVYAPIFEQMENLKAGQGFKVDVPKGVSIRTLQNRLGAGRRNRQKMANDAKKEVQYYFGRTTDDPAKLFVGARKPIAPKKK